MKLVFVYNADSGLFNTLTDIAHKLISPSTYKCNLCSLTHGYFTAREGWATFLEDLDAEIEFLHRDEYVRKSGETGIAFPAIFVKSEDQLNPWIDREVINKMSSVDELMEMIRAALLKQKSGDMDVDDLVSLPV